MENDFTDFDDDPEPALVSRFHAEHAAWLRGLTPDQAQRFLERLFRLQVQDPFMGQRLYYRCAGLKRSVLYGTLGNPAWGRSLLRKRWQLLGLRRSQPLTHHQRRLQQWKLEEEARQRSLGYDPDTA